MSPEDANTSAADHVAVFYRHDAELADQVAGFLQSSLGDAGVAVVVATAGHERLVRARLAQAGVDLAAARDEGRYLALDAAQTLDRFMIGDWPDPAGFWQVIGDVIRKAAGHDQVVRVYGEMVALLWQDGLTAAAIDVEALWNELGTRYDFSLACGYPVADVIGEERSDALAEVCDAHTAAIGYPRF